MNFVSRLVATLLLCAPLSYFAYLSDKEELAKLTVETREDVLATQLFVHSFWEAFLYVGFAGLFLFLGIEVISFVLRKLCGLVFSRDNETAGFR